MSGGDIMDHNRLDNRERSYKTVHVKKTELASDELPYTIQIVAENLYVPWAIAIIDANTLYFTERSGIVSRLKVGDPRPQTLLSLQSPFISLGEGGLMGITLDPDFFRNHYIYVMYTYREGNQTYNRVDRLVEEENQVYINRVLLDRIPGNQIHNGGRIKIGPDQKLYITTGDAGNPLLAQNLTSMAGKILRIELDGSVPLDNPFRNSPIYSYGHRNPQGLAWSPRHIMYASEHGQTAHDEINEIIPGANYGWPLVQGDEDSAEVNIQKPLIHSGEETWAPSGIAYVDQGPWKGKLLVATLRGEQLLTITFDENGTKVNKVESWFRNQFGRLREVISAKDGSIYLTTNNRDGRGNPMFGDDKIIRLVPK